MGIDNNQLVARYFDRKADHGAFFTALEAYLDDELGKLYATLNDTFADDAIAQAHQAGAKIDDPAAEEIATINYLFKELASRGLWLETPAITGTAITGYDGTQPHHCQIKLRQSPHLLLTA